MSFNKFNKIIIRSLTPLLLLASLSSLFVGCGSAPAPVPATSSAPAASMATTQQPLVATAGANLNGAYNYSFQLQNSTLSCNDLSAKGSIPTPNGVSVGTFTTAPISTDNIFKVTLSSGSYTTIPCTGFTEVYSCLQYTVTVGTESQTVLVSYGNPQSGPCKGLPSSITLDFSHQAGPGHGALAVKVSQPQSDNCHTWGYPSQAYCSMAPLYPNYIGAGSLAIFTNMAK